VRALAGQHPEWRTRQPFQAVLERDHATMARFGEHELFALLAATGAGISPDDFERASRDWLEAARHPELGRPFTELVYQPMLDLMAYLRGNAFQVFIVTGGDVDFVRAFSRELYGVPPDRVIGSSLKYGFRETPRGPVVERTAQPGALNDGPAKPENIELHIGVRPIVAVGNSDGDLEMLEYTQAGARPALLLVLHHDDAAREFAYDRASSVGRLDRALDAALDRGWSVISMRRDFRTVFPPSGYR
jgi:phosphoserine phosphatase